MLLLFLSKELLKIGMINPGTKCVMTKIWVMCTFKLIEDATQKLSSACRHGKLMAYECHVILPLK